MNIKIRNFFLFSFIGWLMETAYAYVTLGCFVKRGFLFGPLCPIYGFGAIILISVLSKFKNQNFKFFIYSAVLFSAFEYLVSYILEALFGLYWWDYSNDFLNLNGRISIFYSVAWGIISVVFINYIYPFLNRKINSLLTKIPYKVQNSFLTLLCSFYIVDTVISCARYF